MEQSGVCQERVGRRGLAGGRHRGPDRVVAEPDENNDASRAPGFYHTSGFEPTAAVGRHLEQGVVQPGRERLNAVGSVERSHHLRLPDRKLRPRGEHAGIACLLHT